MLSINRATILGNVGKIPETRVMGNGKEMVSLSVATSESWKDKETGEKKLKTEWHRIVIYNDNIVNVVKNYVKQGSKVYIEGVIQTRKWQNQQGVDQYSTEIVLQGYNAVLLILDNKKIDESNSAPEKESDDYNLDDEIVF